MMDQPIQATAVASTGSPQPYRLAHGGLIDRSRLLRFSFDGRSLTGHPGDTLASALLANGARLVGRSFKYHRPRGILSAGPEEPNALVELRAGARREPNTRATVAELFDGLDARSQNRWPSLAFDLMAVNGVAAPFLAAGFYYKTFMWPAAFWERVYEPLIRRAAGLGHAARLPDPDSYDRVTAHCDVLVVGGGPAGLMAALSAARAGCRVILADEDSRLGGRTLAENREIGGQPGHAWSAGVAAELESLPEVRLLPRTTVFGVYDGGVYGAVERVSDHLPEPLPHQPRQRLWRVVARRCVLAAGAIERPLVFAGNDRPGVMLAGAVRSYVHRQAVAPGSRAVGFATHDEAATTAADLEAAGIAVAAIVDPRPMPSGALRAMAQLCGARLLSGSVVAEAHGGRALQGVDVLTPGGARVRLDCDLLAMSGGWSPSVHLTTHLGGRPVWDDAIGAFVPGQLPPGMTVAGAAGGAWALADDLADGLREGVLAAEACGFVAVATAAPECGEEPASGPPLWRVRGGRGKAFIDFQNDVTAADVALAEREGFRSVEHLKRYTTLGMATDGGKTANVNGLALMAEITERSIPETGVTVSRPPYNPVAIAALAGHSRGPAYRPTRRTPTHDWATEQGAVMTESGAWLRASHFPRDGEADWLATVRREVTAVRTAVGVCDVTTLGKIDVQGADAAAFLDLVYANSWGNLAVGRARYGLMLREDGFVLDDGTTARLDRDRFVTTTTTANAVRVFQHMQFASQVLFPRLDVQLASVTEQWAQSALAGPRARELLARLVDPPFDIGNVAFPYMAAAELTVCGGVKARLFRISFSGELAYEVAVPARFGDALARRVMQAGADLGVTPYGLEALGVMRVEKGHPAGGELNGQVSAHDLRLGRLLSARKDFIGRAMASRPALTDPRRPTLVGLRPLDPAHRLRGGAHLLPQDAASVAAHDQGHVTSVAYSPSLGHWIGLGLLQRGPQRLGELVRAYDPVRQGDVVCEVVQPMFVDPAGERLRG